MRLFAIDLVFLLIHVISIDSLKPLENYNKRQFSNSLLQITDANVELNLSTNNARFFMIGDWGGLPLFPYRTVVQQKVAFYMSQIAKNMDVHFTFSLGDNFYFDGVTNVFDKRFNETFESVFINLNMPFFQVLGNHDHLGNASAQVEYTKYSKRWIMPDFNYSISVNTNNGQDKLIYILAVDTVILCGNTGYDWRPQINIQRLRTRAERRRARDHFKWIDMELEKASKENYAYVLVAGHYPVWSISEHGPTKCLVESLRPLLHKHKVNAYFAGHEHDMEHLRDTFMNATVDYIISGAADFPYNSTAHINDVPPGSLKYYWASDFQLNGAFCLVDANPQNMTISFLETSGKTLYQTVINRGKKSSF